VTAGNRVAAPDPAALALAREALARASGRRRVDLILEASDPEALVQSLPADELYFTIREVGLADAAELVPLASPEQFRIFLDLEAWRGAEVDERRILPWLRAARAGSQLGPQAEAGWRSKLEALDPEVLHLVLLGTTQPHDLEEEPDPEIRSTRFMRTPEGRYVVEFSVGGAEYMAVRGLLDDLYAEDPFMATRLLSALRWELRSDLAESASRWRAGRLADLGFPDRGEALSWFARSPARPGAPAGLPDRPPGFFLAAFRAGTLLDRAASRLEPAARDRLEGQLAAAANAVMVADEVDPGDPEMVRQAVASARAFIEMGLEALSGGEEARAAEALAEQPLKRVFQAGFARVLQLSWRAQRLLQAGGAGSREAPLLEPPLGEAISALVRRRPLYFPGLDLPREEWGSPAAAAHEPRPFRSAAEVERTARALDLAEGLAALARRLGLELPRTEPAVPARLGTLYLTALANERLGRPFAAAPIPAAELVAAARALEPVGDPRLAEAGEAGALLERVARAQAQELVRLLAGPGPRPDLVTALLVRP
jgi:hypothetical protein